MDHSEVRRFLREAMGSADAVTAAQGGGYTTWASGGRCPSLIPITRRIQMARAKRKTKKTAAKRKSAATQRGAPKDAVALLKADHREVEGWFEQFEKTGSDAKKSDLAAKICKALTVHTM